MAFFKFRSSESEAQAPAPAAESLDLVRQRARHRLIGAVVLVLAGVFGFPMVFDSQPRPVSVDIPIEVPDKDKNKPVVLAPAPVGAADVVLAPGAGPMPEKQPTALPVETEVLISKGSAVEKPVEKPADKSVDKPVEKAADGSTPTAEEAKKARALLEAANARGGRFTVQVGAFADAAVVRETRLKLERAGLKTYTHVADTKDGKRTRVRVGPVASLAEADRLAERIKKLDLPAQVLVL